nr:uncharacterized protein LOC129167780 [Nothobranchius furzeri]
MPDAIQSRRDRMNQTPKGSSGEVLPWEYLLQFLTSNHRPASPPPASPRRRRRCRTPASAILSTLPEPVGGLDWETQLDRSCYVGTRLAVCSPRVSPRCWEGCRAPASTPVPGRNHGLTATPAWDTSLDPPQSDQRPHLRSSQHLLHLQAKGPRLQPIRRSSPASKWSLTGSVNSSASRSSSWTPYPPRISRRRFLSSQRPHLRSSQQLPRLQAKGPNPQPIQQSSPVSELSWSDSFRFSGSRSSWWTN